MNKASHSIGVLWRIAHIVSCWIAGLNLQHVDAAQPTNVQTIKSYVCRVSNHVDGTSNIGSGTLIDRTPDGREGLVLTCAHLFREGAGELLVTFADGSRHGARLVDIDTRADLAALSIASPKSAPTEIARDTTADSRLHACGFGPNGIYRCAIGAAVGQATSPGQMSLLIDDPVRSGDSGGGVFDSRGRLVAVIWGQADGVTYASCGKPLRGFLTRITGRQSELGYSCPNGVCPQQPRRSRTPIREPATAGDERLMLLERQLGELRVQKQDRGDYVTRDELPEWDEYALREDFRRLEERSNTRHAGLLDKLKLVGNSLGGEAVGSAVGLFELGGPAGWVVLAVSSLGGWMIGRYVHRANGAGGRRWPRFRRSD
ncbi:MAG: serine protease [Planctomycetota bacterium]